MSCWGEWKGEAYKDSGRRRKASRVAAIAPISNYASPLRAPRSSAHEPHHARSSLSFPPIIHQPLPPSLSRTALGPFLRLRALVVRSPALPFALHPRSYCLCVCVWLGMVWYSDKAKRSSNFSSAPPPSPSPSNNIPIQWAPSRAYYNHNAPPHLTHSSLPVRACPFRIPIQAHLRPHSYSFQLDPQLSFSAVKPQEVGIRRTLTPLGTYKAPRTPSRQTGTHSVSRWTRTEKKQ